MAIPLKLVLNPYNYVVLLTMSENFEEIKSLRLRFSTLSGYVVLAYRTITSIIFTVIVLRKLPVEDYGLFMVIMAFVQLFSPVTGLWIFWIYRYYSRKRYNILPTGFFLNTVYGLLSALLVGVALYLMNINIWVIILAQLIVIISISAAFFNTLIQSIKPYIFSYIRIISETLRVIFAYILIVLYKPSVLSMVLVVLLFYTSMLFLDLFNLYRLKARLPTLHGISKDKLKELFKNFYIPLLGVITAQLKNSAERLITVFSTGSYIYPAFLGVSYIPRNYLIGSLGTFVRALSARLLRDNSRSNVEVDIEDSLRIMFLINIFIAGSLIIYSRVILSIFKPEYIDLYPLFILYTLVFLVDITRITFSTIGTALEKSDLYESGLALRKTLLFKNPFLMLLSSIAHVGSATTLFILLSYMGISDPITLLLPFPTIALIVYSITMYIFYKRSLTKIKYRIPWREILSALAGVMVVGILGFATGLPFFIVKSIYQDIPVVLEILVLSTTSYFLTIYLLSPWVRKFVGIGVKKLKTMHLML